MIRKRSEADVAQVAPRLPGHAAHCRPIGDIVVCSLIGSMPGHDMSVELQDLRLEHVQLPA